MVWQVEGVGVSLVDDRPLELLYFLARGIRAEISATVRHRMLTITVDGLQVGVFPVSLFNNAQLVTLGLPSFLPIFRARFGCAV